MRKQPHPAAWIDKAVRVALAEDIGTGDVTSLALVPRSASARAEIISRSPCIVSGTLVAEQVFRTVDPFLKVKILVCDGCKAGKGVSVISVDGRMRSILTAERTALNFLQRMSGIATLTGRFVRACGGRVAILDTRKTAPGLRFADKYAVKCGGGTNHRMGLYDMGLIKDNHRRFLASGSGPGLDSAVRAFRAAYPGLPVEVEVESISELKNVLEAAPDWILLDNMKPALMRKCAAICDGRCKLEASGGITSANIDAVARTGVDAVSIGALTHSPAAADLSLEISVVKRGKGAGKE